MQQWSARDFCRFPLPCFATGCHAFGFKIATAALRPRNDTKMAGFSQNLPFLFPKCLRFVAGRHRMASLRGAISCGRKAVYPEHISHDEAIYPCTASAVPRCEAAHGQREALAAKPRLRLLTFCRSPAGRAWRPNRRGERAWHPNAPGRRAQRQSRAGRCAKAPGRHAERASRP